MTSKQFIDAVRQYRDHATRKHHSYAGMVNVLLGLRIDEIEQSGESAEVKQKLRQQAENVVYNEYAPADPEFPARVVG
jgi:hypothetical protein